MYSNDQTQIRQGLVSYIGALLKSSSFEGKAAKQNVSAILVEEALKLATKEDNSIDIYVAKPILRGTSHVLNKRCSELANLPGFAPKNTIIEFEIIQEKLTKLIDSIK